MVTRVENLRSLKPEDLPKEPGVYVFRLKKDGSPLYVGRSHNLREAIVQDIRGSKETSKFRRLISHKQKIELEDSITKFIEENLYLEYEIDYGQEDTSSIGSSSLSTYEPNYDRDKEEAEKLYDSMDDIEEEIDEFDDDVDDDDDDSDD